MNRFAFRAPRLLLATGVVTASLTVSACSVLDGFSRGPTTIDCPVATSAIEAYSTALTGMVISLTEEDYRTARESAEAFGPAALAVTRALPGLPPEAEDFVTRSQDASQVVLDSLAGGATGEEILDELDALFNAPEFVAAGDAIDDVFNGACGSGAPNQ